MMFMKHHNYEPIKSLSVSRISALTMSGEKSFDAGTLRIHPDKWQPPTLLTHWRKVHNKWPWTPIVYHKANNFCYHTLINTDGTTTSIKIPGPNSFTSHKFRFLAVCFCVSSDWKRMSICCGWLHPGTVRIFWILRSFRRRLFLFKCVEDNILIYVRELLRLRPSWEAGDGD